MSILDAELPKELRRYVDLKKIKKENWRVDNKVFKKELQPGTQVPQHFTTPFPIDLKSLICEGLGGHDRLVQQLHARRETQCDCCVVRL